jgi:hypothetical protein
MPKTDGERGLYRCVLRLCCLEQSLQEVFGCEGIIRGLSCSHGCAVYICIYTHACIMMLSKMATWLIRTYIHIYIHAYTHTCVRTQSKMATWFIYIHTYVHTYIHTCIYTHRHQVSMKDGHAVHAYIRMYTYTYIHRCTPTYVRTHSKMSTWFICIRMYVSMCIHTYISTHRHQDSIKDGHTVHT